MNISFTLNGEETAIDTFPDKRLADLIREDFGLLGTKCGCYAGYCGTCILLLNNVIVLSCLIPAFAVKGSRIVTIEGFSKTDEYADIRKGFKKAKYQPCEYCAAGKYFSVYALLETNPHPTEREVFDALSGNRCRCDDIHSILKGVHFATIARRARNYAQKT